MTENKTTTNADVSLLSRTRVATPCSADWSQMIGDDKARFCGTCRKNVYNLSAMTGQEAASLIREKEGKLCVRFYQRADGTVLTQDCPTGVAAVRRKITRAVAAGIVGVAALLSAVTQWWKTENGTNLFTQRLHVWAERIHPTPSPTPATDAIPPTPPVMVPQGIMGGIAITPQQESAPVMGEIQPAPMPPSRMGKPAFSPDNNSKRVNTQDRVE